MNQNEFNIMIDSVNNFIMKLDSENAVNNCLTIPQVTQQLINGFRKTMNETDHFDIELKTLEGIVYNDFKSNANIAYTKTEIEKHYIVVDDNIIALKNKLAVLNSQLLWFEKTIANLNSLNFNIKNMVDLKKFANGGY